MSNGLYGMETASEMYFARNYQNFLYRKQHCLLGCLKPLPPMILMFIQIRRRKDEILFCIRCFKTKKISQTEYDQAVNVPVTDGLQELTQSDDNTKIVDNYVKEVINEVQEKTDKNVYTDGLEIYTNLDLTPKRNYMISSTRISMSLTQTTRCKLPPPLSTPIPGK